MNATPPRQIACVRNYAEFCAAIRARIVELEVDYDTIDEIAGLPERYTSKILASPKPIRSLGPMSWGALLGAVGCMVLLVEDEKAIERAKRHKNWAKRERPARMLIGGEHAPITVHLTPRFMRKISRLATPARKKKISASTRRRVARNAAKIRWRKPKVVEIKGDLAQAIRRDRD